MQMEQRTNAWTIPDSNAQKTTLRTAMEPTAQFASYLMEFVRLTPGHTTARNPVRGRKQTLTKQIPHDNTSSFSYRVNGAATAHC
jgi:hypothetical protein